MFRGKIRGRYYFFILGTILDVVGEEHFPRYSRFRKAAADLKDQWYAWDGYLEFLEDVVKIASDDDLRKVGIKAMQFAKEGYVSAGFDSTDAIFRDYDPLLKKNTKQMGAGELPKTVEYQPGYAVIEVNISLPRPLVEGLFQGVIQAFGNSLTAIHYEVVDRGNFTVNRYTITWQ